MHRVYVREGEVFTLATSYATRHPLPFGPDEYVVYETVRSASYEQVCLRLDDGRLLCDIGPEHAHSADGDRDVLLEEYQRLRSVSEA